MAKDTYGGVGVEDRNECHKALQSTTIIRDASAQIKGIVTVGSSAHPYKRLWKEKKSQT